MRFLFFLCGYVRLSCAREYRTALIELCRSLQIEYFDFAVEEDGRVLFSLAAHTAKRLVLRANAMGITVRIEKKGGVPHLLVRYRRRAGALIGTLLAVFLLWLSGRYVWDVRVMGNETMTREEVLEELRACGFGIGTYIPDTDPAVLENRLLIASDRISWISLNLDGTVAYVRIIEHTQKGEEEDRTRPANLIATADGQIESIEILRGKTVVKVGQAVRKGELLVSGLYGSENESYRYTRAAGQVFARTERSFRVEIPLTYTKKTYYEEKRKEIELNFFGFSIKIFKNSRNLPIECDIIKTNRVLEIFGLSDLPIGYTVTVANCYRTESLTRTEEEALLLAYEQLDRELAQLSSDAQILRKEIKTTIGEGAVILDCSVTALENIAEQVEFEITE